MEGTFTVENKNGTLEITLAGRLDTQNAPALSEKLQEFKGQDISRIVFTARELTYISSAGIRVLIFAVQKILKPGADAYFIGGVPEVISILEMTGIDESFIIQDTYQES